MVDYNKIGQRIKEGRKFILKKSQEEMAFDLFMHQADISNLEKAKNGSGIMDLDKLDKIAEYLQIPLETLLFGKEEKNMVKYYGNQMKLIKNEKQMTKSQSQILSVLMGISDENFPPFDSFTCGPYTLYSAIEEQHMFSGGDANTTGRFQPTNMLRKLHTYIFLDTEIICVAVTSLTTVFQHVCFPELARLQLFIQPDILDVTDVWRTLNPYAALWQFSDDGKERDEYENLMVQRMDKLRKSGDLRPVLYIESVYVKEECRRNGIFRMYIDYLKMYAPDSIMWLNMEPTSGYEMETEYTCVPSYTVSELGQININAAIAEKVGFTIDPDAWQIQAETMGLDGKISVENILIRKCAYYLPQIIRDIVRDDAGLVELGRALQKIKNDKENENDKYVVDISNGKIGNTLVSEVKVTYASSGSVFCSALLTENDNKQYKVSYSSLLHNSDPKTTETYDSLESASESQFCEFLHTADSLLKTMKREPEELEIFRCGDTDYYVIGNQGTNLTCDGESIDSKVMEVCLSKNKNGSNPIFALVITENSKPEYFSINKNSFFMNIDSDGDFNNALSKLSAIYEYDSEKSINGTKFEDLFRQMITLMKQAPLE